MLRDAESAFIAASALRLDLQLLFHVVIEAGLAVELGAIIGDKEANRAAIVAFVVNEFVSVLIAVLSAVAELFLTAGLAEEVLSVHVLSESAIKVILASVEDLGAAVAVVEGDLFGHESDRVVLLGWSGIHEQAVSCVYLQGNLFDLGFLLHL